MFHEITTVFYESKLNPHSYLSKGPSPIDSFHPLQKHVSQHLSVKVSNSLNGSHWKTNSLQSV